MKELGGTVEADIFRGRAQSEPDDQVAGSGILQPVGDRERLTAVVAFDEADRLLDRGHIGLILRTNRGCRDSEACREKTR